MRGRFFEFWDALTANHLNAWLDRFVHADDREAATRAIFVALNEYPEMLQDRSWDEIHRVGAGLIESQDKAIEAIGCRIVECNYPMCDCGLEGRTFADEAAAL